MNTKNWGNKDKHKENEVMCLQNCIFITIVSRHYFLTLAVWALKGVCPIA